MWERPELVTPVQNWSVLKLGESLGNAIYFGVQQYNMRKNAQNFKRTDFKDIIEFCHNQKPSQKVYLCTNILIYDSELMELEDLICEAKDAEIDAVIVHDLAAIQIAKKHNMKFHISTQANVSNIEAARFYENIGAERIILARELSLKQISAIKNQLKKTEIECFIHGAMCSSISGRCYFSATVCDDEKFSANRGNCIQPCRRQWRVIDDENNEFIYDGQMFLNAKDLCMIEYIPELIESKIDAFKIEGRMKDSIYVKTVAKCYQEAINSYFNGTYTKVKVIDWLKRLSKVYNRGFHTGFYFGRPTIDDIELEQRGNISLYKKQYLGKVIAFDNRSKSANVLIENQQLILRVGDEIIISGPHTYHIEKIKKIIINGEKIKKIGGPDYKSPVKINIPLTVETAPNDKIYIISKT